jgi:hypothetical protein
MAPHTEQLPEPSEHLPVPPVSHHDDDGEDGPIRRRRPRDEEAKNERSRKPTVH